MGSYSRNHHPARRQRIRSFATGRQRMGVDVDRVPAFSRIPFLPLLSRLLGSLLRWQTLCAEGGVPPHRRQIVAPVVSQLVPTSLSICLCWISLRGELGRGLINA